MASRASLASPSIRNCPPVSHSAPASLCSPHGTKRKRSASAEIGSHEAEQSRPSKQLKKSSTPLALSEQNLRRFNQENMQLANGTNGLKRTSSRKSKTSDISQDTTRTQGVSVGSASYRYNHLADVQVFLHADPPDHVDADIKAIIDVEISEEERTKLTNLAKQFHVKTMDAVRASVGEDDFLKILTDFLTSLQKPHLCQRAKSDWREELKPESQRRHYDLGFLLNSNLRANDQQQEPDEPSPPASKRQQQSAGQNLMSPLSRNDQNSSISPGVPQENGMMPPPITPIFPTRERDRSMVKTPRPDVTVGILHSALIARLSGDSYAEAHVESLLTDLQNQPRARETVPVLISVPAPRASDLAFPFLVIEGKAYSTGKQMFEAENQAAVSGACGLQIQLSLGQLVNQVTETTWDPSATPRPLFFSICTEGPMHSLWAHYTVFEKGVQKFNMTLLYSCNAVKLNDLENFLVAFDNICTWGMGSYFDSVVERLEKVVEAANRARVL